MSFTFADSAFVASSGRLLYLPHTAGGPVAWWTAKQYTPGLAGAAGKYLNQQSSTIALADLDAAEHATAANRPTRLTYSGFRYLHLPAPSTNGPFVTTTTVEGPSGDTEIECVARVKIPAVSACVMGYTRGGGTGWYFTLGPTLAGFGGGATPGAQTRTVTVTVPTDVWVWVRLRARGPQTARYLTAEWSTTDTTDPTLVAWGTPVSSAAAIVTSPGITGVPSCSAIYVNAGVPIQAAYSHTGTLGAPEWTWRASDMGQTGGTSGGRAWSILRAAGNAAKTVLIDGPAIAAFDGVDDRLTVPHHALLTPLPGESLTLLFAYRAHDAPAGTGSALIYKGASFAAPSFGLYRASGATLVARRDSTGGIDFPIITTAASPDASGVVAAAGIYTATAIQPWRNTVSGTADTSLVSAFDAANTSDLSIGALSGGGSPAAFEWLSAALFRRALTDPERIAAGADLIAAAT